MNKTKLLIFLLVIIILIGIGFYLFLKAKTGEKEVEVYRVGVLSGLNSLASIADSFKSKMTELGYIEGKDIIYDINKTDFEPDKEKEIINRFVNEKIDLIVTFPTEVSLAAKEATQGTDIPIVFGFATIEGNNLVDNVRQPGGNITGVREPGPDLFVKRLEILHELAPEAKLIYITYDPDIPFIPSVVSLLEDASSLMDIELVKNPVKSVEEIKNDLKIRGESDNIGIDAILLMGEPLSISPPALEAMINFAAEHKIPIGGIGAYTIMEDVIFSYEIELNDVGELAASSADKILRGTKAGTIPIVTAEPHLKINYKAIQEQGLTMSESLLNIADEIIK